MKKNLRNWTKRWLLPIVFAMGLVPASGQWQPLSTGADWTVSNLFADTSEKMLYLTGRFQVVGGVEANGIARWDGERFYDLGGGVDNCFTTCPVVSKATIFKEDVLCSTGAYSIGGVETDAKGLVKWSGQEWAVAGEGLRMFSGANGRVFEYIAKNGLLYLFGRFQYAGQDTAHSAATWDGDSYASLNFPFGPRGLGSSALINTAVEHDGLIYVGGNFVSGPSIDDTVDFAWYDGEDWHASAETRIKGGMDDVNALAVYKGELFLGGTFSASSGNAGNAIMKYADGRFEAVGGSFDSDLAVVHSLAVYDDWLCAFGLFNSVAGGLPASNMACWDGERWCGFGFQFDNRIFKAAVLDDRLYISGGFKTIDQDTFMRVAYWEGPLAPTVCSEPVSAVSEISSEGAGLRLYPNPATSTLYLKAKLPSPASALLTLQDAVGRELLRQPLPAGSGQHELDVSAWPAGVYFLRLRQGEAEVVERFVKVE